MMPLTPAEKQRRLREKLKINDPEKFDDMKKRNAERTKQKRKKIQECNDEEKIKCARNGEKKKEGSTVIAKESYKSIKKKVSSYGKKIKYLEETIQKLSRNENIDPKIYYNAEKLTLFSKTDSFIRDNLPDVSETEKEMVKKQLYEHNVLISALQTKYKEAKTDEKHVLKDVIESETVKKYKMKSKFSSYLGLKGNIRQTSHILTKRRHTLLQSLYEFYMRDDMSRITAWKKEYKTFRKYRELRHYLSQPLKSLYEKYKLENGKFSYATFKRHRLFFVLPPKIMNRDTCACSKHDNLIMKLNKLYKMNVVTQKDVEKLPPEMIS
ncbi:hypothetical protein ACJJTC_004135 [Scirpophaga incertulas]